MTTFNKSGPWDQINNKMATFDDGFDKIGTLKLEITYLNLKDRMTNLTTNRNCDDQFEKVEILRMKMTIGLNLDVVIWILAKMK